MRLFEKLTLEECSRELPRTKQMVPLKYLITYRCLSKWLSDIQVLNCLERMSRVRFKIFRVEKLK